MARSYRTQSGKTITQTAGGHGDKTLVAIGAEIYREGTDIQRTSIPLVPVDTGALHNSSYVTEPVIANDHVSVEVGYGGVATQINPKTGEPTTSYALKVHEDLQVHHKVGQAKYLEQPFDEAKAGMSTRVIAGVKRRVTSGNKGGGAGPQEAAEGDGGG